jgi:glycosyltransferase involved in cell wall biosynthesis
MKKRLSVLHVTFNMGFGGTEQVIYQIIHGLGNSAVRNEVLCIDGYTGSIGETLKNEGIRLIEMKRQPGFDWRLAKKIRKLILEREYDIVHCHQYTPYLYGFLGSIGTPAKVVFTEHGRFHPDRYRYKAMLINPLIAMFTKSIVAISGATRDALANYEFIPKNKIKVIYNGIAGFTRSEIQIETLKKDLGIDGIQHILGTVSRLDPVKNQTMMLRAFSQVLETHPDCKLLMVGDGPDRQLLEQYSVELAIQDQIIFTGFKSNPERYLACMDIFLLSSHTEGTSMTLLEAMSIGVPTVATRVGGNPEIILDGETGILTKPEDTKEFSEAICFLLSDPDAAAAMSVNSKIRFNDYFKSSVMIDKYLSTYRSGKK